MKRSLRRRIAAGLMAVLALSAVVMSCSSEERGGPKVSSERIRTLRPQFAFRGRIVFESDMDGDSDIYLMTASLLVNLTNNIWQDEYPKWSPDGARIAFSANPEGRYQIYVMNADGTNIVKVTDSAHNAVEHAWLPDGKSIAYTEETRRGIGQSYVLWRVDLETKKTERIIPDFRNSHALPDFSPAAPLMGFTGKRTIGWDVFVYDLERRQQRALTEGGHACRPHFSPDGSKIAYVTSEADGKGDIWLMNPDGSGKERLTERDETFDYFPAWSPDGKYIVFCSDTQGKLQRGRWSLFLVKVGARTTIPLLASGGRDLFPDWK